MVFVDFKIPFNLNLVQPQPSFNVTSFESFSKIRGVCTYPSFCSSSLTHSTISRLHESHPSCISSFFSLKGKRQGLMERAKEAGQPYMQLSPLFLILSVGHFSFHHQWQPWINIQRLCCHSTSSSSMAGGKHQRMKSRKRPVHSWKPASPSPHPLPSQLQTSGHDLPCQEHCHSYA